MYLNFDENIINSLRVGYIKELEVFDERVASIMTEVVTTLESKGAEIIEVKMPVTKESLGEHEWTVLLYEFKAGLNQYLQSQPDLPYQSLTELIEFNKNNAGKSMKWFNQEIFEMADKTNGLTDKTYLNALDKCKKLAREEVIDKLLADHQLDALMAPTNGPAWVIDYVNGDNFKGGSSTLAAVSGYPSVTVPSGNVMGLPIGVSFFGAPWTESRLLQLAYAYEQASMKREKPGFIKSLTED